MSRVCDLTGKKPMAGNRVSHSHRKTNMWQLPNVQDKRIYVPELDRWVKLRLSTRAMRTITKKGLLRFLRDEGLKLKDVAR